MITTTTPEQEFETLQARHTELTTELAGLDQQIEGERTAMGRAVAKGKDGSAHRAKARDLGEQAEGVRRALPLIEADMAALRTRMAEDRYNAAGAKHDQSVDRRSAAVAKVDQALQTFVRGDLAKLRSEMVAALEAERTAASEYGSTAAGLGRGGTPQGVGAFDRYRGLPLLLEVLDRYVAGKGIPIGGESTARLPSGEEVPLAFR